MDYNSGAVLAALNPDQRQYPASLTKMMTSYVVGQALKQGKIHSTDMVTIGESAWGKNFPGSSKMFLNFNQQVSVADLNRGIIIVSGNDACVAMAEHISGNTANFIESMNKYVRQFGLKNTNFTTVHGLDEEGQYSSARDVAILFMICRKNIKFMRKKNLPLTKLSNQIATVYYGIKLLM